MVKDENIGYWAFVWREMKKVSAKEIFSFVMVIAGICVALFAIEPHIDTFLKVWLIKWVKPLEEWHVITAIYIITLLGVSAYLHEHFKNIHLSAPWWGLWIVLTIIYTILSRNQPICIRILAHRVVDMVGYHLCNRYGYYH